LNGRLLALVVVLVVASAAIGAGAAFLLRQTDDAAEGPTRINVAATTSSAEQSAETSGDQQPSPPDDNSDQTAAQVNAASNASAQQSQPNPQETGEAQQAQAAQHQSDANSDAKPESGERQTEEAEQQAGQGQAESEEPEPGAEEVEVEPLPVVSVAPDLLMQGETFALTVESESASAVVATVGGRTWNLLEAEPDIWWTIIPIPRDAATGSAEVVVDLYGEGGVWLRSLSASYLVLVNAAPLEEIVLGGTGTPADPAEVQRDISVRFHDHIAVTGPPRWDGSWILPVEGEVTGVFGARRTYDGVPSDQWHHGHDIAAQQGDPIVAPAPGTVVWTGEVVLHGMGVILDHGAGVYSGYWHMSLLAVREGMEVAPGDWLGNIGTTGLSTGPHLHWEVIIQGVDVDPVQWLGEDQPPLPVVAAEPAGSADTLG
jgi:murein DD-endopeptidase MepM/ murein hydrolase activator NlpD